MARNFSFNASIGKDMKSASADSFLDNMQMIEFSEIKLNKENFYSLSEIELLADDIERQGLKHNLVVCKDSGGDGYWLISGHRRYSAVKLLIEQDRLTSTLIPCYVDGERSQAEARLNLIMLNATQRKYTDAETMAEYEMLKQTIQQLEDEGKHIKGRVREIIANTLQVSPAQVGKIENIRNNAIAEVDEAVKNGEMSISTANEVAKLSPDKQQELIKSAPTAEITHKAVKEIQNSEKSEKIDDKKIGKEKNRDFAQKFDNDFDEDDFGDDFDDDESADEDDEDSDFDEDDTKPEKIFTLTLTESERDVLRDFLESVNPVLRLQDGDLKSVLEKIRKLCW